MGREQSCCSPSQKRCSLVNSVLNTPVSSSRASQALESSGTGVVGSKPGHCCCPWQCPACPGVQLALPWAGLDPQPRSPGSELLCSGPLGASLSPSREKGWHSILRGGQSCLCCFHSPSCPVPGQGDRGISSLCSRTAAGLGTVPWSPCKCSLMPGACSCLQIISSQCNLQISPPGSSLCSCGSFGSSLLEMHTWHPNLHSGEAPTPLLCNKDPFCKGDAFDGQRQLS